MTKEELEQLADDYVMSNPDCLYYDNMQSYQEGFKKALELVFKYIDDGKLNDNEVCTMIAIDFGTIVD